MIRLSEKQFRAVKKITRAACANNDNGYCLLLDDGEPCQCIQAISYSLCCRYFREAVLPTNKELSTEITTEKKLPLQHCVICQKPFVKGSNRAKYCLDCAKKVRRKQKAEQEQKRRLRKKTN